MLYLFACEYLFLQLLNCYQAETSWTTEKIDHKKLWRIKTKKQQANNNLFHRTSQIEKCMHWKRETKGARAVLEFSTNLIANIYRFLSARIQMHHLICYLIIVCRKNQNGNFDSREWVGERDRMWLWLQRWTSIPTGNQFCINKPSCMCLLLLLMRCYNAYYLWWTLVLLLPVRRSCYPVR